MNIDAVIKRIERYIKNPMGMTLIVDIQNTDDMSKLITYFNVGDNKIMPAGKNCKKDEIPRIEEIFEKAQTTENTLFITEISSFLKLQGETELKKTLRTMLDINVRKPVVFVTFQCATYLKFPDPRLSPRISIVDKDNSNIQLLPEIIMIPKSLNMPHGSTKINGIDNFAHIIEKTNGGKVYLSTNKKKSMFPYALFSLSEVKSSYEAIMLKDSAIKNIDENAGTEQQWTYLLKLLENKDNLGDVIDSTIGKHQALEYIFLNFRDFDENKKWLYFIALKLYGVSTNPVLNNSVKDAENLDNFIHNIFYSLLEKNTKDRDFWDYYKEWKSTVQKLNTYVPVLKEYCSFISSKGKDSLYYLTDNTQIEKEAIVRYLSDYGKDADNKELMSALENVYPDLYKYLLPYNFRIDLLNDYFDKYKQQKVFNYISPEFVKIVEDQAVKRDYNRILQPRTANVEGLNRENSRLYFMDALGVEFLSFIVEVCKEYGINTNINVYSCVLPSITSFNKEFIELFDDVIPVKQIDDIKHHGENDYDNYTITKLPIYIIKELQVIREVLNKIKDGLLYDNKDRIYMIADHGASRLAVLYETENIWEMSEKGQHCGRCCKKSDTDNNKPDFATEAGEFWALANYDRFRGGRKGNVEVHGGATLEEVCVPVIEFTLKNNSINVYLLPADKDNAVPGAKVEIAVSFRKKAALKVFTSEHCENVSVAVNGKHYDAIPLDENTYKAELPDIKKPGTYKADVYSGNNIIAEQLSFTVKSEGQVERDIL